MIILYVADQQRSTVFYETILQAKPILNVPGMTEFEMSSTMLLGLMPEKSISKIITPAMPDPATGSGIPRCELYLIVKEPSEVLNLALQHGATLVSNTSARDWGDEVGYCADPDGHIIAFAK